MHAPPSHRQVDLIDEDTKFCDDMLGKVSRSFAAVIRQLPKGLCLDILIFYLALRALDTIEDDMTAFKVCVCGPAQGVKSLHRAPLTTCCHLCFSFHFRMLRARST
jgi:hypothetical protein